MDPTRLGHELIDAEHERLFEELRYLRTLHPDDSSAIRAEVAKLTEYLTHHFTNEETLMQSAGYPDTARHRFRHANIMDEVRVLRTLADYGFAEALAVMIKVITGWIEEHVEKDDVQLVAFLNRPH